jgi:hypothetical protein
MTVSLFAGGDGLRQHRAEHDKLMSRTQWKNYTFFINNQHEINVRAILP